MEIGHAILYFYDWRMRFVSLFCGVGNSAWHLIHSVLSRPRRFRQALHFITVVWFKARYVSRPAKLNARVKIVQKMSLCQVVRLGHACNTTSDVISAVSIQFNMLELGRSWSVACSRKLEKVFSR